MTYSGKDNVFDLTVNTFIKPGITDRIERPVVFNGQTVYIAGRTVNDHQYTPVSLMRAIDRDNINRLELPEGALPYDILMYDRWLLVLVSTRIDNNTYRNAVLGISTVSGISDTSDTSDTSDITLRTVQWTELLNFTSETFARSFEYLNGTFYFGLGCNTNYLSPATGDILSIECGT